MNWVGGARYRVSCHGERKTQKEFFERQKRSHGIQSSAHHGKAKQQVSQDLAALKTVNNVAASIHQDNGLMTQVKRLDLTGYKSTVSSQNRVKEIKIPGSPILTPSKLQLIEATTIDTESTSLKWKEFYEEQRNKHLQQKSLFSYHVKPDDVPLKKKPQSYLSEFNSQTVNQSYKKRKIESRQFYQPTKVLKETGFQCIEKPTNKFNNDLWAPEDFQITPLERYDSVSKPYHSNINEDIKHYDLIPSRYYTDGITEQKMNVIQNKLQKTTDSNQFSSTILFPLRPIDTFLEDQLAKTSTPNFHKIHKKQMYPSTKLPSRNESNSSCSSKIDLYESDLEFLHPTDIINRKNRTSTWSGYDGGSESTPLRTFLPHSNREQNRATNTTLAQIKADFNNQHQKLESFDEDFKYMVNPISMKKVKEDSRCTDINFSYSKMDKISPQALPIRNKYLLKSANNHTNKLLNPLFMTRQKTNSMNQSSPRNQQDFIKLMTPSPSLMSSFEKEYKFGLEDESDDNINIENKKLFNKKIISRTTSEDIDEVLAELSQLQHESDKENVVNESPSYSDRRRLKEGNRTCSCTPVLSSDTERSTYVNEIVETMVHDVVSENKLCNIGHNQNVNLFSNKQSSQEYERNSVNPRSMESKLGRQNVEPTSSDCTGINTVSVASQESIDGSNIVTIASNKQLTQTLCNVVQSQSLISNTNLGFTQTVMNKSSEIAPIMPNRKETKDISEMNRSILTSTESVDTRTKIILPDDSGLDLSIRCDTINMFTQTNSNKITVDKSLSPILFLTSKSTVDVGTQWEALDIFSDSPTLNIGCFELFVDDDKNTQLNIHPTTDKHVEHFSSELVTSSQDSFIALSQNMINNSYSLRSRQKCELS